MNINIFRSLSLREKNFDWIPHWLNLTEFDTTRPNALIRLVRFLRGTVSRVEGTASLRSGHHALFPMEVEMTVDRLSLAAVAISVILIFGSPLACLFDHNFKLTVISMLIGIGLMLVVLWQPKRN
jgi:hypothetical protein